MARTTRPASISHEQELVVLQACSMIPPGLRDDFLRSVANRLRELEHASDLQVADAINFALSCYGVIVGPTPPRRERTFTPRIVGRTDFQTNKDQHVVPRLRRPH